HTYYEKNYISKCVETLKRVDAVNVGGPIVTLPGDKTLLAKAIALATSHPFGVGNSKFRTSNKAEYVDTVPFGAFRREIFDKIGLFNEKLPRNQDIEFNSRIRKAGFKIFLNPDIKSFYYNRSTLRGLWRQNFINGMWNIFTHVLSKNPLSTRHYVPLIFVTSLIVSIILALMHPAGIFLFSLISASYLVANIFFTFRIGFNHGFKVIPFLLIVFFTLHFSYGLGSIFGVLGLKQRK
ncbi:MAG: glycosyltransferase family 2 protein, partial [Elusimicrobiota bacterium]